MFKFYYFTLTLYFVNTIEIRNEPGSDFCSKPQVKPKLEVAFVIDQSSHYIRSKFSLLREIVGEIYREWPGSKVGVAGFSDYTCLVYRPPKVCKGDRDSVETPINGKFELNHKDPQGCYKFHDALSSRPSPIKYRIHTSNLEYLASGNKESGLAGIYRTVAEPKMKWTRGRNVADNLIRIIFVVSDDVTHSGKNPNWENYKDKKELKGDGTDECRTMHNPSPEQVGKIMKKDDMVTYMLYADTAYLTGKRAYASWVTALKATGRSYKINQLNRTSQFKMFKTFVNEIKNTTENQEIMTCADPPSYNTLGL